MAKRRSTYLAKNEYLEWCKELIGQSGGRVTRSRVAVIECIGEAKLPLSAGEIYEQIVSAEGEEAIDKVSVYRTLEMLLEFGAIHQVNSDGRYIACVHSSCEGKYHILSRCTECESVRELDVPQEVVAPLLFHMENALRFSPDSHLLHLDGICQGCQ